MLSVRSSSKILAVLFSSCSLLPETSPQSEFLEAELEHARILGVLDLAASCSECLALAFLLLELHLKVKSLKQNWSMQGCSEC